MKKYLIGLVFLLSIGIFYKFSNQAFVGWQPATFTTLQRSNIEPWQNSIIDSLDVINNKIYLSEYIRDSGLDRQFYKRQMSGDLTSYLKVGDTIKLKNLWRFLNRTNYADSLYQLTQNSKSFTINNVSFDTSTGRTILTVNEDLYSIVKQGVKAKNKRTGQNEIITFMNKDGYMLCEKNWGNKAKPGDTIIIYNDAYSDGITRTIVSISNLPQRMGTGSYWFTQLSEPVPYEVLSMPDKCYPVIQYPARSNGTDVLYDLMLPDGQISDLTLYWENGHATITGKNEFNRYILDTTIFEESYAELQYGSLLLKFKEPPVAGKFYVDYKTKKIAGADNHDYLQSLILNSTTGLVTIPAGDYIVSGTIYLPDNIIVEGTNNKTTLYQKPGPETFEKHFFATANDTLRTKRRSVKTKNVTVRNLTIVGALSYPDKDNINITITSGSKLFNIQHSDNIEVINCTFSSGPFDGIYAGGGGYNGNNLFVYKNHLLNAGRNNLTVTGTEQVNITYNLIEQDGIAYVGLQQQDYGIRSAFGAKNVDFETNTEGDKFDVTFTKNIVQYSNYGAMGISPRKGGEVSRGVIISNNLFYFNQDLHIRFGTGTSENSIVSNNIFSGGRLGVDVNGHNVINITNNSFNCETALRVATANKKSYGLIIMMNSFTKSTNYGLPTPGQDPELYQNNLIIHNANEITY